MNYIDDYPTCRKTFATLCIYHDALDPLAVSESLSLKPSDAQKKGESVHGATAKTGAWFLSTEHVLDKSKDLARHLDWLLGRLPGKEDVLLKLRDLGYDISVSCYWLSKHGHGGPQLLASTMKRLGELEIPITFDCYFAPDTASRGGGAGNSGETPTS
jgi:hypothetical protein